MSKQRIGILCLFLILALLSIRTILLTPGTVGHNWDWSIPSSVSYLQHFVQSLPFTWRSFSLGEPISLWLPSIPFSFLFYSPSFLGLGGDFISKFLMISTIVLSGMGMFLLVENILQKEWKLQKTFFASFLAGFFYAFSPFLFAEFIGGAATQFFAYALLPWLLFFVRRLNQKSNFFLYLLLSSLILSLITISLQVLVLSSVILVVYALIQPSKFQYLKNLFFVYFVYFFFNLYWIIPTVVEYANIYKIVSDASPFSLFTVQNLVPSLTEAFINAGYTRPFFLATINEKFLPIWFFLIYFFVFFIFLKNLTANKKESVFWFLFFSFSLIFTTGGKEPFGDQVVWLYQYFAPMSLFRSPQHFIVLPILAMAILIGLGYSRLKYKFLAIKILFLGFIFLWVYPFFSLGDLGSQLLRTKRMEHLDVFRLSPGYQEVFNLLAEDKDDYKILFLPIVSSPYFLKTEYQNESQGGDPLVIYTLKDTVVADIGYGSQGKKLGMDLEENLCQQTDKKNLGRILGTMNMKYLILRKDVIPHFSECKNWDWQKVYQFIRSNPDFVELKNADYVILFENKKNLAHFFAVNKIVNANENLPAVNSKKINPTRYEIEINKASSPYLLTFSESFNPYWKVYPQNANWFTRPIFEDKHSQVNSFANGWYIDKPGDYNLIVEYWPQRFVWLGGILSLISLVLLILAAIKNSIFDSSKP